MGEHPVFIKEYCNGCGLCANVCSCKGIQLIGNTIVITTSIECDWCTQCEAVCPTGAIQCPYLIVVEERAEG